MKFSIILLSHNKPRFVIDAIESLRAQTLTDWECTLIDSGILEDQGFFDFLKGDPRFFIMRSCETESQRRSMNMAGWCFNNAIEWGLKGELVMYLCDDDLLKPACFETFWNAHLELRGHAYYSGQEVMLVSNNDVTRQPSRMPCGAAGGCVYKGQRLLCQVDYLQFCHSRAILGRLPKRPHSERRCDRDCADGLFMERIGKLVPVYPVNHILSVNRRTPQSVNRNYWLNKMRGLRRRVEMLIRQPES